jgi:NAD(P)-dependent dehydrogenase (short-subunit alcohol dehydrogenase family)
MTTLPLQDRVAVVTGAGRGIGKAIALALARAGAGIILVGRDRGPLDQAAIEIGEAGGRALVLTGDVTDEEQVTALGQEIAARHGGVQILVNNAGVNLRKPITEFALEEWRRVLDTNLVGPFLMCRALVPMMTDAGYGRILNLTSMLSHVALPGRTAYCASKAGLLGFTRALALELAPRGITVNGISPGPVATEMNRPLLDNPELQQQFTSRIPLGRWGTVEEVAGLAVYLCSEAAGFMTGTDFVIDGGWCAQ